MKYLIVILCWSSIIWGQEYKIQDVTLGDLEEKSYAKDASANARYIYKIGSTEVVFRQETGFCKITKVKERIKIYNNQGYDHANIAVRYYKEDNNSRERIDFSNAYTYTLDNGKVVRTKLKSDGEFDEKANKYWSVRKIKMPNIQPGCIIEYQYEIISPFLSSLPDWEFQESIPVSYSQYKTYIPEYFTYAANQKGYLHVKMETARRPQAIHYTEKERREGYVGNNIISQEKIDYQETITTYSISDVPALHDESFVNNIRNYSAAIMHELSTVMYPHSPMKMFSTDWGAVAKTIYEGSDFGPEINRTGYYEEELKAALAGASSEIEKMAAVYKLVRSNVKWDGYYGYGCNEGVRQAWKNHSGNVAEINLMLISMLRSAGLSANPVLVSTRGNGIPIFPNRDGFNYVIAAVDYANGLVFLDATDPYAGPNMLPVRDLNWMGRLIRKDGSSQSVDLIPKQISRTVSYLMYKLDGSGAVSGQCKNVFMDYNAMEWRTRHNALDQEKYLEEKENDYGQIAISNYKRENLEKDYGLSETFDFNKANAVEVIGDKMYISPLLFMRTDENPFKMDTREYPIDFRYPNGGKTIISMEIPAGYVVESLPKSFSMGTETNLGGYKYTIVAQADKVQINVNCDINNAIMPSEWYPELKDFFQRMVDKENEKIVLKKV